MLVDGEDLVREIVNGKRLFEDVVLPEGFDFSPYVAALNETLRSSSFKTNPLIINGGNFAGVKAEGIFLRSLNAVWEPEKPLFFVGANLKNADLRDANLRRCDFTDAVLSTANLENVNLENAVFYHANLRKAKLVNANLSNVDLSTADLEEANLTDANLCGAGLANTNLHKANLTGVEFFSTDLRDADLSDADLTCSCGSGDFTDANFSNAVMKKVEYDHSLFIRARFKEAVLDESSFYKIDFSDAFFEKTSFRYVYAEHIDFCKANLRGVCFNGCELRKVDFTDADLAGADFGDVTLDGVYFCRANLLGVKNIEAAKGFGNCVFVDTVVSEEQKRVIEEMMGESLGNRFIVKRG